MKNSEKSYLGSIGFEDPDRREPLHDMGCLYLAQPEKVAKIMELWPRPTHMGVSSAPAIARVNKPVAQYAAYGAPGLPRPVAFFDVAIGRDRDTEIVVEVKTKATNFGNTVAQLNYYATISAAKIVLACFEQLDGAQKALLTQSGFGSIYLDTYGVRKWYEAHARPVEQAF